MGSRVASLGLLLALAMTFAGCSSSSKETEENPNQFPANYKDQVLITLTNNLEDPTNIRGALISDPVLRRAGTDERYVVCIRFESRNANRQYTGVKDRIAFFYAGYLNQLIEATKEQCGSTAYKPFPELEKLCQAKKCA